MAFVAMTVCVLGAGPAGASAAAELERLGVEVVVLDRAGFPREKACGGVLPFRVLREFDVPEDSVERPLEGYRLFSRSLEGVESRFPSRGAVVSRAAFDHGLVRRLESEVQRFEATGVEEAGEGVRVVGRDGAVEADLVVAADGARSAVRRSLGVEYSAMVTAYQYVLELGEDAVDAGFGDWFEVHYRFSRGYGWVAPLRDRVKVGVGGAGFSRNDLDRFVGELGERLEGAERVRYEAGSIPMAGPAGTLATERVALAGDAGGFVFPGTGEGIYYGMKSGRAAARAAARALEGDSFGKVYREMCAAEGLLSLRKVNFLETRLASPEAADRYVRSIAALADRR